MTMTRLFFVFIFSSSFLFAQDKKNQIYLNADDVIPALFSSQSSAYNLGYRRLLSNEKTLRFGLKYFYEDDNEYKRSLMMMLKMVSDQFVIFMMYL